MNNNTESEARPVMAALLELESEGLVRSFNDDQGKLRWVLTDLGKTFRALCAEGGGGHPPTHRRKVEKVGKAVPSEDQ